VQERVPLSPVQVLVDGRKVCDLWRGHSHHTGTQLSQVAR
jgi:hypothetical protein